jgi:hypothetical protein
MKYRAIGFILLMILLCVACAFAQDAETLRRAAAYEPLMIEAGGRRGVDPRLLWTIAYLETRFRPDQVSRAGARGMMQFMPVTAKRFNLRDPHQPADSIDAAARYLRKLQTMFEHRLDLILAAYNSGEDTVMAYRDGRRLLLSNGKAINPKGIKTGGVPPYRETRGYVNDGITLYLRLAGRRELDLKALKIAHLKVPGRVNREEPAEPLPQEITELKQGSIYIVNPADSQDTPASPSQISSSSIYPR